MKEQASNKKLSFVPGRGCSDPKNCTALGYCWDDRVLTTLTEAHREKPRKEIRSVLRDAWVNSNCLKARPAHRDAGNELHRARKI